MNTKLIALLVCSIAITACAKTPSNITAIPVASSEYANYSCSNLAKIKETTAVKLEASSEKQRGIVAGDAATVFLVLVPVSKLAGDEEGNIAQLKGEVIAIDRARAQKGCA